MMRCLIAILLSFFLANSADAGMCGDSNTMIERTFDWDFQHGFLESIPLPMVYGDIEYPSTVRLHLGTDGRPQLFGRYDWSEDAGDLGFEYNLYRLQIQIGEDADAQLFDKDYTNGCKNVPRGLDHGGYVVLPPIKLFSHADGSPLGIERVHIRFWGK